jgi:HTH-type transcriptional regulator/antitoxin HigA
MATVNEFFTDIAFHPGETLAEKLDELKMGPKEFAIRSGKPEKTIIGILKGESSITPEMAVLFESVLKIPARFWIKRQYAFDEYKAFSIC